MTIGPSTRVRYLPTPTCPLGIPWSSPCRRRWNRRDNGTVKVYSQVSTTDFSGTFERSYGLWQPSSRRYFHVFLAVKLGIISPSRGWKYIIGNHHLSFGFHEKLRPTVSKALFLWRCCLEGPTVSYDLVASNILNHEWPTFDTAEHLMIADKL